MMEIQKKELDACLVEKLGFIKKMNDILPELNCQNELLKEATITVQNLLVSAYAIVSIVLNAPSI